MSSKAKNPYADTEFIRAYHETLRAIEEEFCLYPTASISTTTRPDRVLIRLELLPDALATSQARIAAYERNWPDAANAGFSAALFSSASKLYLMAHEYSKAQWADTLRAQTRYG